jgi:GT2 family glycosyltransferase
MFEKIAIGIKTFLRDDKLFETVAGTRENLPGARMLIADCGEATLEKSKLYRDLAYENHRVIHLPFDAGFGAMSNAIVELLSREYLLVGSDDFDFRPREVRGGIEKLIEVLDYNPEISIASGRVNNRRYEFDLIDEGSTITEIPIDTDGFDVVAPWYVECDLTVNYSLIRREVFEKVRWDDEARIGEGEHGAFFVDVKRAGFKVAYVPGVNINQQPGRDSERYRQYRLRANNPARSCFDKRGIKKWVLGNGQIDYERKES